MFFLHSLFIYTLICISGLTSSNISGMNQADDPARLDKFYTEALNTLKTLDRHAWYLHFYQTVTTHIILEDALHPTQALANTVYRLFNDAIKLKQEASAEWLIHYIKVPITSEIRETARKHDLHLRDYKYNHIPSIRTFFIFAPLVLLMIKVAPSSPENYPPSPESLGVY